jgi:AhpC/TSA family
VELQGKAAELRAKGFGLAAISYDSPEILAEFSRRYNITFPLLSDTDSRTIKAFGILNTVVDEILAGGQDDPAVMADYLKYGAVTGLGVANMAKGTPYPGTFMIDRNARVTSRFFEEFYRERITAANVLMRAGAGSVPVEATKISAGHAEITTYATDAVIAPGNRFALAVNVVPGAGIHVYAPGVQGYRPVKLTLAGQPYVRILPAAYPPSETYFFKPLNERVPAYQKPFTLMQEIVLEVSMEAVKALAGKTELNLTGVLQYQACDDKKCFNPVSVPVAWQLKITPNLPGRARPPR